jgi:alkanesulfonate monooxygenase SsuD/methylene tetrahydromethanopterin reductase-like flavin-dependent oxidoreductase (luciferase family)
MPMRIGLFDIMQIDPMSQDDTATVYRRRLDDLALADELGIGIYFTAERHFMQTYRCPAPSVWLAAASQRTKGIRLGVMAYTLPLRSAVWLAEEVAVLDHLTGGRLEVGLGLGHRPEELVAVGVDPAARVTIFQERLALLQALWTGGQVTLENERHQLKEVAIHPLPLQEPHPPLWYAGTDPGAAGWAGSRGMGLALGFKPSADLLPTARMFDAARHALVKTESHDATVTGVGPLALMRHVYVAESDDRARAEMTDDLLRLRELHHPRDGEGGRADRRAAAAAEAETLVRNEVFVAGSPETVARAIARAHSELGAEVFLANVYAAGIEPERIHRALRLLAGEVTTQVDAFVERANADR